MVQLLNSIYLGAATPSDYGKAAGVVELLPFEYYLGAAVPSHGKPTINVLLSGVSPLTLLNAVSLNYVKAFGKCEQASTPTPTSPVDIICNNGAIKVKDDELPVGYKRLLDVYFDGDSYFETGEKLYGSDVVTMTLQADSSAGQNVFGAYSGSGSSAVNFSLYVYATNGSRSYYRYNQTLLRPTLGTGKRTISFGNGSTSGFNENVTYDVESFETTDTAQIGALPNSSSPKFTGYFYGNITIGNRLKYIPCERISDSAIGYYETVNGEFLENQGTGTLTTSGYDTSHLTEIYIDGTVEVVTVKQAFVNDSDIVDRTGLNSSNGSAISNNSRCYVLFPCKAGVTYTAQTDTADLIGGNFIEYRQPVAASANFIKSITATDDGLVDGVYQFHAVCDTDGWAGWQCKANKATAMANNWQITTDTSSATCQPLLSVGTYKDVQNITNGAITRNIGVYVLYGTENWQAVGTSYADGSKRYYFNDDGYSKLADSGELCTHFVQAPLAQRDAANQIGHFFSNQNSFHIRISSSLANDVSALKNWLKGQFDAGHPVMFTYPLATATTETVTGQTLTITQGTNIVTAEGSVDDLELEVSYKAYAEVTVEEIEAVNTDENVEVTIS